jgi:hypothetical protein
LQGRGHLSIFSDDVDALESKDANHAEIKNHTSRLPMRSRESTLEAVRHAPGLAAHIADKADSPGREMSWHDEILRSGFTKAEPELLIRLGHANMIVRTPTTEE